MNITTLVNDLFAKDAATKENATQALLTLGAPAVQPLLQAIIVDDYSEDGIGRENRLLRQVFVQLGEPAFQATSEALKTHPSKRPLVKTLTLFNDARAVPALIDLAQQALPGRSYAIDALGYFKDPRAFDPLLRLLAVDDLYTVVTAAAALAEYRDERAVAPIQATIDALKFDWPRALLESCIRASTDPTYTHRQRGFFIDHAALLGLK